ncbi:heparan-alpha-glucosaminide N-acetyltransferase domain-containing protein [Glutamicibacter arilaitensis]|uniref:heparan-alpha-glucosaminide N-acetyltransferase domain-containing protein n=1 Tax=Glutamicibacter arilaitensis TaxID=256701 RepID=UPI001866DFEA|nr:heparan-alpha-glucosaminide N-acetyltransferase domain-containing protein [Glutamicibacter arilaitensis]
MNETRSSRRLLGVDAARLVAILGMFAAHIFPLYETSGIPAYSPTFTGTFTSGRASVLFMVLAGLSLTLLSTSLTRKRFSHPKVYSVLVLRALIIAVLGMAIGSINEGIAIILVHYGLLFLLLPLVLKLPRITIWVVSALWLVLMPILWRPLAAAALGQSLGHNPSFGDLLNPQLLFKDLTVTGYYPLLVWLGFGLLGVALGSCNLRSKKTAGLLALVGSLIAILTYIGSRLISLQNAELIARELNLKASLVPTMITTGRLPGMNLEPLLDHSAYLWLPTGHSNSLLSTLHNAACAVAIIGLLLLIIGYLGPLGRIVAGAGRAPLTLYVGHLILLPAMQDYLEPSTIWWILVAATAIFGIWLGFSKASGPLEYGVRVLSGADVDAAAKDKL